MLLKTRRSALAVVLCPIACWAGTLIGIHRLGHSPFHVPMRELPAIGLRLSALASGRLALLQGILIAAAPCMALFLAIEKTGGFARRDRARLWLIGGAIVATGLVIGMGAGLVILDVFATTIDWTALPLWWWRNLGTSVIWHALLKGWLGGIAAVTVVVLITSRRPQKLHGDARWARWGDVRRAHLAAPDGIILGRFSGHTLRLGGTEHVMVEAPTRSGKGVGVVIPTLLEWTGSAVILDIKQENWEKTAGFRATVLGQVTWIFDPLNTSGRTARYNPLGYFDRTNPVEVIHELQKIGVMLFPEPKDGESFWLDSARSAFIGVGAYVAATPELPFTIGEIYRQVTAADAKSRFLAIIHQRQTSANPLCRECVSAISDYVSGSDNTHSGIRQTVTSRINLWLNPYVDAATSESDFSLADLRRSPMSLYLGVSPDDIERIQPLYNLICQQIIDLNVRELPTTKKNNVKVLLVLDEFARLGRAQIIAQAFSFVAGYGLRLLPIVQSRSQLRAIYGADTAKEILTNCGVEVIFGVKEDDVSRELESRVGTYTFKATGRSRGVWESFSGSVSISDQRRPLLLAQEIRELDPTKALVFRAATPPILATKIRYYEEERMVEQSSLKPPTLPPRAAIGERRDAPAPTATIAPEMSGTTTTAAAIEEDGEIAPVGTDSAIVPDESVTTTDAHTLNQDEPRWGYC